MTPTLPANASLEQLKNQAKDLVKQFQAREPEALRRVKAFPLSSQTSRTPSPNAGKRAPASLTLSDAQRVIALEYGFPSWPKLRQQVLSGAPEQEAAVEAFKRAVQENRADKLRTLLRSTPTLAAQIDAPWFSFDSPAILIAAGNKDRKMVEVLLDYGADINARSRWWAGSFGVLPHADPEFGAYLIERGALVDVWAAAGMDRRERLAELIAADPSLVHARGGDGQTPLHFAASLEVAQYLLEHGAEIDIRDIDHGSTPAQWMAADRPDICRYLLSRGAEADIFMAVQVNDLPLVRKLLAEDPVCLSARVGQGSLTSGTSNGGHIYLYTLKNGHSPLYLAAALGHTEIYRLLLERSTPVERLLAACLSADEPAVREALRANPEIVKTLGAEQLRTLPDAAWQNRFDAVRLMLELGFDIEARGDEDSTALNRAAVRGYADIIGLLLERGASPEAKNAYGGTALTACLWGAVNFRDPKGDYVASVEKLLAAGAILPDTHTTSENRAVNAVLKRYRASLSHTEA